MVRSAKNFVTCNLQIDYRFAVAEQRDDIAAPQVEHATTSQVEDHGTLSLH